LKKDFSPFGKGGLRGILRKEKKKIFNNVYITDNSLPTLGVGKI